MKLLKEFRDFTFRGNILDLAIAVIIGGAFGKIVTSFVNDILMPAIGLIIGRVDLRSLKYVLHEKEDAVMNGTVVVKKAVAELAINYGNFIQTTIDFVIVAFCIFLVFKTYQNFKKKEAAAPVEPAKPTVTEELLSEIRDLLKTKGN